MYGIVSLVLQKEKMVSPHNVVWLDSLGALAFRIFRPRNISLQYRETDKTNG